MKNFPAILSIFFCAAMMMVPVHAQSARDPFDVGVEMRATWYGPGYIGKRTASGERFDPHALTAAHATLPLGASVLVRATDGHSVMVRINDRAGADVIDLSPAAARALHLLPKGSDTVTVMMTTQTAELWVADVQ